MNVNAQCYYNSALKLYLPVEQDADLEGFAVNLGKKRYFFYGLLTPFNNTTSVHISRNKFFTNKVLEKAGIPVPKAVYIHSSELDLLDERIANLKFPLVAKPMIDGRFGADVLCNIPDKAQLLNYLNTHLNFHQFISLEEFHPNLNSYRVLIFNKKILGIILRKPAQVTGDGIHTIKELIALDNIKRSDMNDTLKPILLDDECRIRLNELGIDEFYIPRPNETIMLCYTCNASRGGTYASLTPSIAKENRRLLIKASQTLGLNLVGFDVLCKDITQPIETTGGVIIESNDSPSIRIHEHAIEGHSVAVSSRIIRQLIYRHPFSYLYHVSCHKHAGILKKGSVLLALLAVVYYLG